MLDETFEQKFKVQKKHYKSRSQTAFYYIFNQ